jgi:hypothetical protein
MSRWDATDSLTLLKSTQSLTPLLACVNLLRRAAARRLDQCLIPAFARAGTVEGQSPESLARENEATTRPIPSFTIQEMSRIIWSILYTIQAVIPDRCPECQLLQRRWPVGGTLTITADRYKLQTICWPTTSGDGLRDAFRMQAQVFATASLGWTREFCNRSVSFSGAAVRSASALSQRNTFTQLSKNRTCILITIYSWTKVQSRIPGSTSQPRESS